MKEILVDIVLPMAAIALLAMILHNPTQTNGSIATVTSIYKAGVGNIRS